MVKAKKKILVLTDHLPWGHRSIAKAIFNYLKGFENRSKFEVEYLEVKARTGVAGDVYVFSYRYLPTSNILAHKLSRNPIAQDLLKKAAIINLPSLKKEVEKYDPDLIISAYFFHTHSLAKWREESGKKFKLWTVISDPWTINPILFAPETDLSLVYDDEGKRVAKSVGISEDRVFKTGWWVRPEMYKQFDRDKVRKSLGFDDDRPVIFVGGGSLGTNSLTRLLPTLLVLKKKVGFIFNTGTDKLAYNLVQQFIKLFKQIRKDDLIQIKHFSWIENMAEILSACDMVFGKAGPNFLFDVAACGKPFVAITHIGGQEDGNIDLIRRKKLGWVKERAGEINKFLINYLDNPKVFEKKYLRSIKVEANKNQKSLPMILDRIRRELR